MVILHGLFGENIPLFARIVCVADAFDAMTSTRSYRPKMTLFNALDQLEQGKSTQFDPNIVDVFIMTLKENMDMLEKEHGIVFITRHDDEI